MNRDKIKQIITERGNVRVIFEPSIYDAKKIPKGELVEILNKAQVSLRGWNFPHIPSSDQENSKRPYSTGDGIEFFTYWDKFAELFRLYQSGQFIGMFALYEDTIGQVYGKNIEPGKYLDFISTVYRMTEIVIFIRNLMEGTGVDEGELTIEINGTNNRELEVIFSQNIFPLNSNYICHLDKVVAQVSIKKDDIVTNYLEMARGLLKSVFEDFNWTNYSDQTIKTHQENFLNRRYD